MVQLYFAKCKKKCWSLSGLFPSPMEHFPESLAWVFPFQIHNILCIGAWNKYYVHIFPYLFPPLDGHLGNTAKHWQRKSVICQGELLGVGTGIQSTNNCYGDAKNNDPRMCGIKGKQLPARLATGLQAAVRACPAHDSSATVTWASLCTTGRQQSCFQAQINRVCTNQQFKYLQPPSWLFTRTFGNIQVRLKTSNNLLHPVHSSF